MSQWCIKLLSENTCAILVTRSSKFVKLIPTVAWNDNAIKVV